MNDLLMFDILKKCDDEVISEFIQDIKSNYEINNFLENKKLNQGLAMVEITLPYIENIYKNPNRLIVNEEEIVKIELAKKVTVESVKHLSKNTNFIQKIEDGDVTPSKILNIFKEETFFTYENKLVYTLIQNIKFYINDAKEKILKIKISDDNETPDKNLRYNATKKVKGETIKFDFKIDILLDKEELKKRKEEMISRIEEMEKKVVALENMEAYVIVDKKHIPLVKAPLRKTNLILKNVNFNYAMKLWDFLQEEIMTEKKEKLENKQTNDEIIKKLLDELGYLGYLILINSNKNMENLLNNNEQEEKNPFNLDLTNKEINNLINKQIKKGEFKDSFVEKQIRKIFEQYFNEYLNRESDK